ncbi:four helix bundle protein [Adhaeribacter sp. BT258]|uniref:Four helix bundle protein n=1 Tax=Adhaeribacter terrigena TaxID=2793070 RepID=A0ABS1C601_9BACT|nr:four helix bundle protein [Adhaeribacter terrigena]MBK0404617.1 four helix bundle protein [Adhaeribacter terrigena]
MVQTKVNFADTFKKRTKKFALDVIHFSKALPRTDESLIIKRQLLRSATSVAANYRAVCRARSAAEFHSKLSIVVEEADESLFWLEIISEAEIINNANTMALQKEITEILSVMATARKNTAK